MERKRVKKLEYTHANGVRLTHAESTFDVCQIRRDVLKTLMALNDVFELYFRVNDGLVYKDFWVHFFCINTRGVEEVIATGQRENPERLEQETYAVNETSGQCILESAGNAGE